MLILQHFHLDWGSPFEIIYSSLSAQTGKLSCSGNLSGQRVPVFDCCNGKKIKLCSCVQMVHTSIVLFGLVLGVDLVLVGLFPCCAPYHFSINGHC